MSDREKKIRKVVEDNTGIDPGGRDTHPGSVTPGHAIRNILFVAPDYDFFQIEEEGRLHRLFKELPSAYGIIPNVEHVDDIYGCLEHLRDRRTDLLIIFNGPTDGTADDLASKVKKEYPKLPVVLVGKDISSLKDSQEKGIMDMVFTWNGDGKFFVYVTHLVEDTLRYKHDELQMVLLVENNIQFFSQYLPLIYEEIFEHEKDILQEELTAKQEEYRVAHRPAVLFKRDFAAVDEFSQEHSERLLLLICDMNDGFDRYAGLSLVKNILKKRNDFKILLQSSESIDHEDLPEGVEFVMKGSPSLYTRIKEILREAMGPLTITVNSHEVEGLRDLENALISLPGHDIPLPEMIEWLKARREFSLANKLDDISDTEDTDNTKDAVLNILEDEKYSSYRCTVSDYKRETFGPHINLCRMGGGALGGKSRGIVFVSKLLTDYLKRDMLPGLDITVPRTLILSTDVFDKFIEQNELLDEHLMDLSDERIAARFMGADLPATILGDLRAFVRQTKGPMIVRSSGVLEDAVLQPFAGVYSSLLLPNESWETDLRFQDVCSAVKYVYASTFFEVARTYLRSTPKNIGDEKMAVMVQEAVGKRHDNHFYPTISGVARSYDHYPPGCCPPDEGTVYLALGLGKSIVEGGRAYRFCPNHPKATMKEGLDELLKKSQTKFYALNMETLYKMIDLDEEKTLSLLDLKTAERHGELTCVASTYVNQSGRLYPGINYKGPRVVDFAPILVHEKIPLANGIRLLLKMIETALDSPVEIEFAVNVKDDCKNAELYVLQVRSMKSVHRMVDISIDEHDPDDIICYSHRSLGNGVISDIKDIVLVKDTDMTNSPEIAKELRKLNKELLDRGRPYILIGPGRWGSADRWLGIPVDWSDISGARLIVETPLEGRAVEPSQGSHFFHDMIASDVGYMVIKDRDELDLERLKSLETLEDKKHVKHLLADEPFEIKLDGRKGEGIIVKGKAD